VNHLPLTGIPFPTLPEWFEILLLWVIFYHLLKLLRGTRGAQVLSGFALTFAAVLALTYFLNLWRNSVAPACWEVRLRKTPNAMMWSAPS